MPAGNTNFEALDSSSELAVCGLRSLQAGAPPGERHWQPNVAVTMQSGVEKHVPPWSTCLTNGDATLK